MRRPSYIKVLARKTPRKGDLLIPAGGWMTNARWFEVFEPFRVHRIVDKRVWGFGKKFGTASHPLYANVILDVEATKKEKKRLKIPQDFWG